MCPQKLLDDCQKLINNCQSLIIATTSGNSSHSSYVPFIWANKKAYILVSALAEHTGNLKNTNKNRIGCMLIEDESAAAQIFARRRLMFKSTVAEIDRAADQWPVLIGKFKQRYGEIIELLESLPDFTIFELEPEQIVLVKGFGDAHDIKELNFS
ncbi:MAG: HugZ family protein [Gammaproteobacteria bacterium]